MEDEAPGPHDKIAAEADTNGPPDLGVPVETGLGGAFYLLNLFEALDLPAAYDPGWTLSRDVAPWDVLAAFAQALIADVSKVVPPDPLWALLAGLGGRAPRDPAGAGLEDPGPWTLPPALRDALPAGDDRLVWSQARRRILLRTAGGVPLAEGSSGPGALRELAAAAGLGARPRRRGTTADLPEPAPDIVPVGPALARLARLTAPALRMILSDAFGTGPEDRAAVAAVLFVPARVHAGPSHIDVVLPIEAISLPVRRACLDRDPGWLPAWGRVVTFHFD